MKLGILTSSRADYGIYLPLLNKLKNESFFELEIIAFGTHLSKLHGYTLSDIEKDGYKTIHKISCLVHDDSQKGITISYGMTIIKFSDFWENHSFDLVFCLGDRFEMSAAVQASIPFGVKLAHIHGGETSLGAIDNIYRHQISLASKFHFTSTELYRDRVVELIESDKNVFDIGALSLSNIREYRPINKRDFFNKYNIKDMPYCLVTFPPETYAFEKNKNYVIEMIKALEFASTKINLIVTMPNADNLGTIYREKLYFLKKKIQDKILLIENFGKEDYFSAMYYSDFLLGNTSSGIIEAASFGKYVINVGDRQKGRLQSLNIYNVPFESSQISSAVKTLINKGKYLGENLYFKEKSEDKIIEILKTHK